MTSTAAISENAGMFAAYSRNTGSWGNGATHAVDLSTAEESRYTHVTQYRSRCGQKFLSLVYRDSAPVPFSQIMMPERCGSCERIINRHFNPHVRKA